MFWTKTNGPLGNISPAQSIAAIGGNTAESQSAAFIQVTACPTWPLMCTIVCDAARASRNKELCESWHYGVQDRHQPEELHRSGEKFVLKNKKAGRMLKRSNQRCGHSLCSPAGSDHYVLFQKDSTMFVYIRICHIPSQMQSNHGDTRNVVI